MIVLEITLDLDFFLLYYNIELDNKMVIEF